MAAPTGFDAGLLSQLISPAWFLSIRAKPEPCNLQSFKIDQGIERGGGQSCKDRVDEPIHTYARRNKKEKTTTIR